MGGRRARREDGRRRALRRRRRHPGARRLRRPGERGEGPGGPLRTRAGRAVLRDLSRDAVRGDRVRAQRLRPGRRQLHGIRAPPRPQPHRPPARAAHARRQGRDDAPRPLSDRARRGQPRLTPVRAGDHSGAAPPPVRGQQRLRPQAREAWAPHLGDLGREAARRDHRDSRAPVLRGRAVPPGVPLTALGSAPTLRRLNPCRARSFGPMTPPRRRKRSPEPGTSVTKPRRAAPARTRSGDAEPGRTSGRPPSAEGELAAPATTIRIGRVVLGGGQPLALIGGPCAIENEKHALETAERIATIAADRRVPFIYKSSYDKANRSSIRGYRGPGLTEGLRILKKVRDTLGVPVLSDVHQVAEVAPAAEVLDVLQIPAFLCRQTDLIVAVARTGKPVNGKKGQFLAPDDMRNIVDKILSVGHSSIL